MRYWRGEDGSIRTVTDAKGELPNVKETRVSPVPGDNTVLSMDLTMQKYATQAALAVMEEKQAKRVRDDYHESEKWRDICHG